MAIIGPLEKRTSRAIDIVADSSTAGSAQREGKREWIAASREQVRGILEYRTALKDIIQGNHAAFRTAEKQAKTLIVKSLNASAKADRRLGISVNY